MNASSLLRGEIRITALVTLLTIPFLWSASATAGSREEAIKSGLVLTLLGSLPLLAVALLWPHRPPSINLELRYGKSRREEVARSLARKTVLLATSSTALVLLTLGYAYEGDSGALLSDLTLTFPIVVLSSSASCALFGCARAWFGRIGLSVALLVCWTNIQDSKWAVLFPLAHVRGLIRAGAGPTAFDWTVSGFLSHLALVLMTLGFAALLLMRTPR